MPEKDLLAFAGSKCVWLESTMTTMASTSTMVVNKACDTICHPLHQPTIVGHSPIHFHWPRLVFVELAKQQTNWIFPRVIMCETPILCLITTETSIGWVRVESMHGWTRIDVHVLAQIVTVQPLTPPCWCMPRLFSWYLSDLANNPPTWIHACASSPVDHDDPHPQSACSSSI